MNRGGVDTVRTLQHLGGVAHRAVLERRGISGNQLARGLQAGAIIKPHRGLFALPGVPTEQVLACYFRARVTCVSAARLHGLPLLGSDQCVHLEVNGDRGGRYAPSQALDSVAIHRLSSYVAGQWLVSPARAIDVAGRCLKPLDHLAIADAALAAGTVSIGDLARLEVSDPGRAAYLAQRADGRAGSLSETWMRMGMLDAGLTVQPQAPFRGVGRVDFLINGRLVVECDGRRYHSNDAQFALDRRRDRDLLALGMPVVRFTFADAVYDTARSVEAVQRALAALDRG